MLARRRLHNRLLRASLHTIRQLLDASPPAGTTAHVQGWVVSLQHLKNKSFAMLNDGTTHERIQAVLSPAQAAKLSYRTSVSIQGKLVAPRRPESAQQRYDIQVDSLDVIGHSLTDIPIQNKYNSAEYLRQLSHFRPQTQASASILRLQSAILQSISSYFVSAQFIQTLPPVLTSSDCEGAGETFQIDKSEAFFGKPLSLAVSSQLHLECLAMGVQRVWTLAPTFRAEKSTTSRHLSEFRMLEAELSFCELKDVLDTVEHVVRAAARGVMQMKDELMFLHTRGAEHADGKQAGAPPLSSEAAASPWPRIKYTEALTILQEAVSTDRASFKFKVESGCALQTEHEQFLARHFDGPVFVTHYPAGQKPFYMLREGNEAVCFDLLVPGMGELCGGSMREHDYDRLVKAMKQGGIKDMAWYADLRKYGTVPHGGFGIGFERLVGYLIGVTNVREVAAFPRWLNHCVA